MPFVKALQTVLGLIAAANGPKIKCTWAAQNVLRHAGSCAEECGSHHRVGPDYVLGVGEPAYPIAQLGEHGVEEVVGHPLPCKPDHLQPRARPCNLLALHHAHALITSHKQHRQDALGAAGPPHTTV